MYIYLIYLPDMFAWLFASKCLKNFFDFVTKFLRTETNKTKMKLKLD